ncbi:putative lipid II flippase FtsW [Nocardioides jiangxiensis]|uniref:Probable peptidoglycan glycosyltransferase FtsW n=1 Tax=Nocardioides jiangxiensis TaxID=3064524 RepID=A0ABT9B3D3_9ACTN|nr:putative lipid II flippase FtsW [Nocardioides sp. WY-20]MDO7869346.1 putative lipid II flippase FtsW [Nocardioides sp. WY-20]
MTTATPDEIRERPRGLAALKEALERPLTPYYLLLGCTALLLTLGLLMVLSASSVSSYEDSRNSYAVVERQLIWVVLGVPAAWLVARLPQRTLRNLSTLGLLGSMVLLAATLTPLGVTRNHQTNWLGVGPFVIQPSEFAKLAVILWAAHIYANKERRLGELQHIIVPVVPGVGAVTALILLQRDLGTALVLFAITLSLLWVVGAPAKLFTLSASVIAVGAFWLATTSAERRQRLLSFTDPFKDYHDSGWQAAHGLLALSSGGLFGKGIGASQQKWGTLPESYTDYIFAVLGEELGLVGTVFVIGLFLTIAWAAVRIATQTRDPFVRYVSFGVMVWLLGQMIVNVGMVLSLLPVIGIPLPLVSYGGSALLPSLIALGILIGFARREPEAAAALAARKRNRPARPAQQSRGL